MQRMLTILAVGAFLCGCRDEAKSNSNGASNNPSVTSKPSGETMTKPAAKFLQQDTLFDVGQGEYSLYRIPALVVSKRGTVLAFCEGRKEGWGDAGLIHEMLRRSFDNGKTWSPTQIVVQQDGMTCGNPCPVVETADGSLYLSCRNNKEEGHRAYGRSRDGGLTFGPRQVDMNLSEAPTWGGCQGSLMRFDLGGTPARSCILFANPTVGDPKAIRKNMTVRVSYDDCKTWSAGKVLYAGPAGYSDLTVAPDGTILCLYERSLEFFCGNLTLARFNMEWLTDDKTPSEKK